MLGWLAKLLSATPVPIHKVEEGKGPESVRATLLYMKNLVINSDKDRIVKTTARTIIKDILPSNHELQVQTIVAWVRRKFKYVRDIYGVEELTDPVRILYNIQRGENSHSSDCDDFAVLIAALLRSVGFRTRLEALAVNSKFYNHARMSVYLNGTWVTIEGTRNVPIGDKLPSIIPIMFVEVI